MFRRTKRGAVLVRLVRTQALAKRGMATHECDSSERISKALLTHLKRHSEVHRVFLPCLFVLLLVLEFVRNHEENILRSVSVPPAHDAAQPGAFHDYGIELHRCAADTIDLRVVYIHYTRPSVLPQGSNELAASSELVRTVNLRVPGVLGVPGEVGEAARQKNVAQSDFHNGTNTQVQHYQQYDHH